MDLETPLENLPKVGEKTAAALKKLGLVKIRDLFFHFPARYEDFRKIAKISDASPGQILTLQGKIAKSENIRAWRKHMIITQSFIEDESGAIRCVWFNQPYLLKILAEGTFISVSGKISLDKNGLYITHPSYEILRGEEFLNSRLSHTAGLVPIYPETAGMTSRFLRYLIKYSLPLANNCRASY